MVRNASYFVFLVFTHQQRETAMKDPKYAAAGMGPGGSSGGPHMYADVVELLKLGSAEARLLAHAAFLQQVAQFASDIRDTNPGAYKQLSGLVDVGVGNLVAAAGQAKF
jgi:hypothetical protein